MGKEHRKSLLEGFGGWITSFVIIPFAWLANCCIWTFFTPLPPDWAVGVCLISCGFIYCISPVNFIPNSVPILGKLDDFLIGICPIAFGFFCCYEANKKEPLPTDPMHTVPLAVGAIVLLLSAVSKSFRETALGVIAMILTPILALDFLPQKELAVGVTLLVWGFLYIQLPWDLIPDKIPLIGRLDDMVFGWGFIIAGAAILWINKPEELGNIISNAAAEGVKGETVSQILDGVKGLKQGKGGAPKAPEL